jgi:hypothetical protein
MAPVRDARFVDLILADRRQERAWPRDREPKIEAIATSTGGRDRTPGTCTRGNPRKVRTIRQRPRNAGSYRSEPPTRPL